MQTQRSSIMNIPFMNLHEPTTNQRHNQGSSMYSTKDQCKGLAGDEETLLVHTSIDHGCTNTYSCSGDFGIK